MMQKRPSSAHIWVPCAGAIAASAHATPKHSRPADEGTAGHWVWADCIDKQEGQGAMDRVGAVAPNGVVITATMAEGAQAYLDDVHRTVSIHPEGHFGYEQPLGLGIQGMVEEGTPDSYLYVPSKNLLVLWDYKGGHREVEAWGNLQMASYLHALARMFDIDDQITQAHIRIVQPFAYHASGSGSTWSGTLSDWRPYWNDLKAAADPDRPVTFSPGKHCRDCPSIGTCPAARKLCYDVADYAKTPYSIDVMEPSDLAVERGLLKDAEKLVKNRISALEDQITHNLQTGKDGGGLQLRTKAGNLKWSVPDEVATAFAAQFGIDNKKEGVLTPTQTVGKVPKEHKDSFKKAMEAVSTRAAGSTQLVQIEKTEAHKAFQPRSK